MTASSACNFCAASRAVQPGRLLSRNGDRWLRPLSQGGRLKRNRPEPAQLLSQLHRTMIPRWTPNRGNLERPTFWPISGFYPADEGGTKSATSAKDAIADIHSASPVAPHELLNALAPGIDNENAAIGRNGNIVGKPELAVLIAEATELRLNAPPQVHDRCATAIRALLRLVSAIDNDGLIARHGDGIGSAEISAAPLFDEVAAFIEHLHPGVLSIGDIDTTGTVEIHRMRKVEFPGPAPLRPHSN